MKQRKGKEEEIEQKENKTKNNSSSLISYTGPVLTSVIQGAYIVEGGSDMERKHVAIILTNVCQLMVGKCFNKKNTKMAVYFSETEGKEGPPSFESLEAMVEKSKAKAYHITNKFFNATKALRITHMTKSGDFMKFVISVKLFIGCLNKRKIRSYYPK